MIRKDSGTAPSCAIVRVTLLNRGSDAYRPEEYGDSITVERRIALSGGYNGYRLLDSTGKEKSRCKKDLDNMLDTLNIQVDNPVAVLDQEEAKKFLMGKDEDKYAFFMKATELENIDRKVCTMKNDKEETELTIDRKKDGLQAKVQHVHQLKQQLSEFQQLGKLKIKRLKLIAELCWAEYNSADEGYNQAAEILNTYQAKLQIREKELQGLRESEMNPADELQSKRERIESLLAEAQEQSEARKKLEEDLKEANQPYKNADRELSALKRHIESAKKQHKAAKQKLKEKRDEIIQRESSAESEAARRTIQLQKAEERKSHIEATIDELKEETSKWYNAYEEAEGPTKHAKAEVNEINGKLNRIRSNIQSLKNSSGNSLAVYGRNVPRVAEMVRGFHCRGFHCLVVLSTILREFLTQNFLKIVERWRELDEMGSFGVR
jgi:structural maintenance of chromosomes protein 6